MPRKYPVHDIRLEGKRHGKAPTAEPVPRKPYRGMAEFSVEELQALTAKITSYRARPPYDDQTYGTTL